VPDARLSPNISYPRLLSRLPAFHIISLGSYVDKPFVVLMLEEEHLLGYTFDPAEMSMMWPGPLGAKPLVNLFSRFLAFLSRVKTCAGSVWQTCWNKVKLGQSLMEI